MENDYQQLLGEIKQQFEIGRVNATRAVNTELINLYYAVGQKIIQRQKEHGWGKSIVERLAKDLQKAFPVNTGFSARNLWDMRRFYERYSLYPNLRQVVAEIPWGIICLYLIKPIRSKKRNFILSKLQKTDGAVMCY